MARPLRIEYDGALYHITTRGNDKKAIFQDEEDRDLFLTILYNINQRHHWICHAYCLMNNHYHLVIETPDGNLSKGMRQLNGVYTQTYNKKYNRAGHLFQGRYKAILIQKEPYLLEVCRYVVLNPVRAKAAKSPKEWKWSSYLPTAGLKNPHPCLTTDWILAQMGTQRAKAEKKYKEFVHAGIGSQSPWDQLKGQSLLGEGAFTDKLLRHIKGHEEIREIPKSQRFLGRPTLEQLLKQREKEKRDRKIQEAVGKYGYSQKEVADHLKLHYSTVSRLVNEKVVRMSKGKT